MEGSAEGSLDPPAAENTPTVTELTELIAALKHQQENSEKALAELQKHKPEQKAARIVIPRERKIKPFSGAGDSSQSLEDFIEEVECVFAARNMGQTESLDFLLSHLESPARDEVKLYAKVERNNARQVFAILEQAFGEKRSIPLLLKSFYDRQQNSSETLLQYSHVLRELFTKVITKCPSAAKDRDLTLRDQFTENVRDIFLRKELKKLVRRNPSICFLDVREEAIRWSEDDPNTADHFAFSEMIRSRPAHREPADASKSVELSELMSVLKKQQAQLDELTNAMSNFSTHATSSPAPKFSRRPQQPFICYNCGTPGHIARNCPYPSSRQHARSSFYAPPQAAQTYSHQAAQPYTPEASRDPSVSPQAVHTYSPKAAQPSSSQAAHASTSTPLADPNVLPLLSGAISQGGTFMARK